MNPSPATKVWMLRNSLRCFVFGLLGWIPLIGLPFAVAALVLAGKIRKGDRECWNAARAYRLWGGVFAAGGTIFWFILAVFIIARIVLGNR